MIDNSSQKERPLVMVVDDDEDLRLMAGKALKRNGFSMVEARDGIEALALLENLRPEIILLDIVMPIMNGFETCTALRRLPGGDALPVVVMTSFEDVESINRAYEVGATDFITKPINWIILGQRVRYMIRAGRTANALRRSEAQNAAILNAIPDVMFRMNKEGVFLEVKGSNRIEMPIPPDELPGRRLCEIMPAEVAEPAMKRVRQGLDTGCTQIFEYSLQFPGKLCYYEARIVACGEEEVLCIVRDISIRKKMEEDLLKAKKFEAMGIFAGGIAHDFNNLLTVILCNIDMAETNLNPDFPDHEFLAEAENATLHARDLIRRFIAFSTSGMPMKEPASIETLVMEVICPGSDSRVTYTYSFPRDLWSVEVNQGQIRQAIGNIVVNAREAMPNGGVINILAENMEVTPQSPLAPFPLKEGKYVKLSIEDEGIGIKPENFERVFDPYFSTKERGTQKGMGLGLTVAYSIVKRHGGHISLESEPGRGTVFHLYIPA